MNLIGRYCKISFTQQRDKYKIYKIDTLSANYKQCYLFANDELLSRGGSTETIDGIRYKIVHKDYCTIIKRPNKLWKHS